MLMKPDQYDAQFRSPNESSGKPKLGFIGRTVEKIENYLAIRGQRRALLSLDDHMLHDIGISRAEAEGIASKPFDWLTKSDKK